MTRLCWATDLHLTALANCPGEPIVELGRYLAQDYPEAEMLILSGDTSHGSTIAGHLLALHAGWQRPIGYVLGNHDYYQAGWDLQEDKLRRLPAPLALLDRADPLIFGGVALVGQSGWFDGMLARDIGMALGETRWAALCQHDPPDLVRKKMQDRSKDQARQARNKIMVAYRQGIRRVVLVTHAPPYRLASWHQGAPSEEVWLNMMTSAQMGHMLDQLVQDFPDLLVTVLCGHTHSAGEYHRGANIRVLTGPATLGAPGEVPGFGSFDPENLFVSGRLAPCWDYAISELGVD